MRHLVRDDRENILLRFGGGILRIEKQDRLVIGDAAPVLHRAAETARDRDQVELGQRIRNAEILIEVVQDLRLALERITTHLRFPFGREDAQLYTVLFALNGIQLAGDQDDEITRHRGRKSEVHFFATGVTAPGYNFLLYRHVRDRGEILRDDGGELEAGAETGLVPAREHAARVRRLELRPEHGLFFVRPLLLIAGVEKPLPLRIDPALKLERELVITCRQFVRQSQRQRLLGGVELDRFFRERLVVHRGGGNFDLERVEHDLCDRLLDFEFNRFRASEGEFREIRIDPDRVFDGQNILGQLSRRGGEIEFGFGVHVREGEQGKSSQEEKTHKAFNATCSPPQSGAFNSRMRMGPLLHEEQEE